MSLDALGTELLVDKYLDGLATAEELRELECRLLATPDVARQLIARTRLEAALESFFQLEADVANASKASPATRESSTPNDDYLVPATPARKRYLTQPRTLALGLLLLAGIAAWWFWPRPQPSSELLREVSHLPRLLDGRAWVDGIEGNPIHEGSRIDVRNEPVILEYADGSRVVLEPESSAAIHVGPTRDRAVLQLLDGAAAFSITPARQRFRVETPLGAINVLGTDFQISLASEEPPFPQNLAGGPRMLNRSFLALIVSVSTGLVEVEFQGQTFRIAAGENRVFADGDKPDPNRRENPFADRRGDANGKFVSFNPENRVLIIEKLGEGPQRMTFVVAKDVRILLDGKPGTSDKLTEGQVLTLTLNADRTTVTEIRAEGPIERRIVFGIDPKKRTLLVREGDGKAKVEVTYPIVENAPVMVGKQQISLSEVKQGDIVFVRFSYDRKAIVGMLLRPTMRGRGGEGGEQPGRSKDGDRPREGERLGNTPRADAAGRLVGFDAEKNVVVLAAGERDDRRTTFAIAKEAVIILEGKEGGKLTQVPETTTVNVWLNADKTTIVRMSADRPTQRGSIFAIDADKQTVTLRGEGSKAGATFAFTAETTVRVGRNVGKITDLKVGDAVWLSLSLDKKTIRVIETQRREGGEGEKRPDPKREGGK